jgi:hypothetical protein
MENLKITLMGVYFVVENPYIKAMEEKKALGLILQEKDKKDLVTKEDLDKLKVVETSKDCKVVKPGMFVKINNARLANSESFEKGKYIILSEHDVLFIYK